MGKIETNDFLERIELILPAKSAARVHLPRQDRNIIALDFVSASELEDWFLEHCPQFCKLGVATKVIGLTCLVIDKN